MIHWLNLQLHVIHNDRFFFFNFNYNFSLKIIKEKEVYAFGLRTDQGQYLSNIHYAGCVSLTHLGF